MARFLPKNVLVSHKHRQNNENQQLLQEYKDKDILKHILLPTFSKDLKLTCHTNQQQHENHCHSSSKESAIYILQIIKVDKKLYSLYYNTSCCDMVSRYDAVKSIGSRAVQESSMPISIDGVGNSLIQSNHGNFKVWLPLFNGSYAVFSKICISQITVKFPHYPLKGKVQDNVINSYKQHGGDPKVLPKLPYFVGGHTDFILSIKDLRYYPGKVFQLPSQLTIYRPWFKNAVGTRGVIGGPHKIFTEIESKYHINTTTFISDQVNPDASLLHCKVEKDYDFMSNTDEILEPSNEQIKVEQLNSSLVVRNLKIFEEVENAGSQISYRYIKCRDCKICKEHEQT